MTEIVSQLKDGMATRPLSSPFGPEYSPRMVSAITSCTAAISRLDARFCASSVATPWQRRAAWSGYTKALQLQSAEIDEIDVFSWGCGLQIPDRPARATHLDTFAQFAMWQAGLDDADPFSWRDNLPTAIGEPAQAADHPPLVRALNLIIQFARLDGDVTAWLSLPFALRDLKVTSAPLPCLVGGAKAFRLKRTLLAEDWLAVIRGVESMAVAGLDRIHALEQNYRAAQRAIVSEYRPGALPSLLALTFHRPLLSPQSVSNALDLSVAGASKLLARAASAGLLIEITERQTWKQFLVADLAVDFGFATPKRGRPKKALPPLPQDRTLTAVFDDFDAEMARIDALLATREDIEAKGDHRRRS